MIITEVDGLPKNGKLIEETIGKEYDMVIPYARVNKTDGHVVVDGNDVPEDFIEKICKEGFQFEGKKHNMRGADGKELKQFSKESMNFLEKIVKKKIRQTGQKNGHDRLQKTVLRVQFRGKKVQ